MKSLEEYKKLNYKAIVQFEPKEDSYFVEFPELPGCMADAATAAEAIEKALKAKDEWLEIAFDAGYKIPKPAAKLETTGRQTVRMPKSLHARVLERAEEEGVSQNQLILSFIAEGLARMANQEIENKVLTEISTFKDTLKSSLTAISNSLIGQFPQFSRVMSFMPSQTISSNEALNRLWEEIELFVNANAVRNPLRAFWRGGATYATADMISICPDIPREEGQMHVGMSAAGEESFQGGYKS
jgi:predicted RNase H-like HicB family nuclease